MGDTEEDGINAEGIIEQEIVILLYDKMMRGRGAERGGEHVTSSGITIRCREAVYRTLNLGIGIAVVGFQLFGESFSIAKGT